MRIYEIKRFFVGMKPNEFHEAEMYCVHNLYLQSYENFTFRILLDY